MRKHLAKIVRASLILIVLSVLVNVLFIASAKAQTSERVYSFSGVVSDGIYPFGGVVADSKGNFYGTTGYGGNTGGWGGSTGNGTVFKINKDGKATVLYAFTPSQNDGAYPQGGLVIDSSGNLYGTTYIAGDPGSYAGTVFEIKPNGTEVILHSFMPAEEVDGAQPTSTLTLDSGGNLYGTTTGGGAYGPGTIFKINAKSGYSLVYSFTGGADGGFPYRAPMILDSTGNLYGVTEGGGASNFGVVYELSPAGKETVLYSFTGGSDGGNPIGALARDAQGNLYGVTNVGGANGNGVVYKLSSSGQQTVLHAFGSGFDGQPLAGVILDASGNIYSTTTLGGAYSRGSVFKLDSSGNLTTLHSFNGGPSGGRPHCELIENAAGDLFGTTVDGGTAQAGAVFELLP